MLGGMWGYQNYLDRETANNVIGLIKNYAIAKSFNPIGKSVKGKDQEKHIWGKLAIHNSMTHVSYYYKNLGGSNIQTFTIQFNIILFLKQITPLSLIAHHT